MHNAIITVPEEWRKRAFIDRHRYRQMYRESIEQPDAFWAKEAGEFAWQKKWDRIKNTGFCHPVSIRWFEGATLNITENCLDRHLPARAGQTAYIWEGDDPAESKHITYRALHEQVCRLANALKKHGVKKGDRVTIYLPMIPEAAVAMLACARIGAVHSVVFAGFAADALKGRIEDCGSKLIITADEGLRGGKKIPLKANVEEAIRGVGVTTVLVVRRTGGEVAWEAGRDCWYHEETSGVSDACPPERMDAEDPLFILYTSGATGKPKGVLHTTAGYMVWAGMTHKYTFDYHAPEPFPLEGEGESDIFWCTADVGWVTGHTYLVYGPLLNAATSVMYEGVPNYPDSGRFWQVVDKHKVTIFHTAPTAIRALMREGDAPVERSSRESLRLLGSVGEPINPEAWLWYWRVVGKERCPIVDTWWQTETGGHMITPLPGATDLKPGSATLPFFGVQPVIVDPQGVDLRLMSSLNDVSGIPTEGKNLIIVAAVNHVLHFRIFDGDGKVVVDTDEKRLADQAQPIEDLRKHLESLWPPHEMTRSEKGRVVTAVISIVDHTPQGKQLEGAGEGLLYIADSWPGQARTIWGDHTRFEQTYFSQFRGLYFTGDGARRDEDGYYWITGREDDVINVSGRLLGTAEIESALVAHKDVAEAAVVGFPHEIKGQGIYAYVTLNAGIEPHDALHAELVQRVRRQIGPFATPDRIHFTPALPKTRSGKIMRRILRKIAEGEFSSLGDTSTLTNPEIVEELIRTRKLWRN